MFERCCLLCEFNYVTAVHTQRASLFGAKIKYVKVGGWRVYLRRLKNIVPDFARLSVIKTNRVGSYHFFVIYVYIRKYEKKKPVLMITTKIIITTIKQHSILGGKHAEKIFIVTTVFALCAA